MTAGRPPVAPFDPSPRPMSDAEEAWADLRRLTAARIGLQRSGASLATGPLLAFQLAHARARDAVQEPLDEPRLIAELGGLGVPFVVVSSAVENKSRYLMRPDLGRRLSIEAETALAAHAGDCDVAFVVTDGLSARAVQMHAASVLAGVLPTLAADGWRIAPLIVVRHGRVAIGDAIANVLHARSVAMLIGERPGLSAPDSMGAYLTWQPHPQTTDADRNCISNIRPEGVGYSDAAFKITHLLRAMRAGGHSGVRLKDDSDRLSIGGR